MRVRPMAAIASCTTWMTFDSREFALGVSVSVEFPAAAGAGVAAVSVSALAGFEDAGSELWILMVPDLIIPEPFRYGVIRSLFEPVGTDAPMAQSIKHNKVTWLIEFIFVGINRRICISGQSINCVTFSGKYTDAEPSYLGSPPGACHLLTG